MCWESIIICKSPSAMREPGGTACIPAKQKAKQHSESPSGRESGGLCPFGAQVSCRGALWEAGPEGGGLNFTKLAQRKGHRCGLAQHEHLWLTPLCGVPWKGRVLHTLHRTGWDCGLRSLLLYFFNTSHQTVGLLSSPSVPQGCDIEGALKQGDVSSFVRISWIMATVWGLSLSPGEQPLGIEKGTLTSLFPSNVKQYAGLHLQEKPPNSSFSPFSTPFKLLLFLFIISLLTHYFSLHEGLYRKSSEHE